MINWHEDETLAYVIESDTNPVALFIPKSYKGAEYALEMAHVLLAIAQDIEITLAPEGSKVIFMAKALEAQALYQSCKQPPEAV